jgi:peptidyl-tRNA hydrolase
MTICIKIKSVDNQTKSPYRELDMGIKRPQVDKHIKKTVAEAIKHSSKYNWWKKIQESCGNTEAGAQNLPRFHESMS